MFSQVTFFKELEKTRPCMTGDPVGSTSAVDGPGGGQLYPPGRPLHPQAQQRPSRYHNALPGCYY